MLQSRQPVTDAGFEAFQAHYRENPKPHLTSTAGHTRIMSTDIMGDWLLSHPGCTDEDVQSEFTDDEIKRFFKSARQYAIRKSGDLH